MHLPLSHVFPDQIDVAHWILLSQWEDLGQLLQCCSSVVSRYRAKVSKTFNFNSKTDSVPECVDRFDFFSRLKPEKYKAD